MNKNKNSAAFSVIYMLLVLFIQLEWLDSSNTVNLIGTIFYCISCIIFIYLFITSLKEDDK